MPGIVGIIGSASMEESTFRLRCMTDAMMHESFYTSGIYISEPLRSCVGWVSHEASFSDCMPVWNETRDVCVIFSGEDFTETGEIARLRARGHRCDLNNATYLVHLYEEGGIKFLERLNGWFNGVVIDFRERKIVLFNDRYGLRRIYYHEHATGFYFSSEAKSLLRVLPELRQLDLTSLGETFSCGSVLEGRTLFSKIALLPGAARWTFTGKHGIKKETYFSPEVWENQPILSGDEYCENLQETFIRILPKYLRAGRQIAMSLTGGLDGRMIMAWANPKPGGLPCYTFGGQYRDSADVKIGRQVANLCQQAHETIVVGDEFLREFPTLAEKAVYFSDGTMDITGSVELYVNRIARSIAPIRLTGNYGSEIIRGNVAFRPHAFDEVLLQPTFSELVRRASLNYGTARQGHSVSFIAFKQVPWHHYSRLAVEESQLTLRSPFLDNDLVSVIYQAPPELVVSRKPSLRLIADGNAQLARILTDRGLTFPPIPLISKAYQLHREFTAKAEYAYDYGMPQWLAPIDHLLAPLHLERLFLGRHKFYHFRLWYRDRLAHYLKDVLLDPSALTRPYINGRALERMVHSHIEGRCNYTLEIHRLLTAELCQRQLIEHRWASQDRVKC